ncbi:MAG: hypothetical protein HC914_11045, partial [Chloroflexaceae bacterium]|nr:hypothetical protein [Chloroflexaceae bacterium]
MARQLGRDVTTRDVEAAVSEVMGTPELDEEMLLYLAQCQYEIDTSRGVRADSYHEWRWMVTLTHSEEWKKELWTRDKIIWQYEQCQADNNNRISRIESELERGRIESARGFADAIEHAELRRTWQVRVTQAAIDQRQQAAAETEQYQATEPHVQAGQREPSYHSDIARARECYTHISQGNYIAATKAANQVRDERNRNNLLALIEQRQQSVEPQAAAAFEEPPPAAAFE